MFEVSNLALAGSKSKSRLAIIVQWELTNDPRFEFSNPFAPGIKKKCKKVF